MLQAENGGRPHLFTVWYVLGDILAALDGTEATLAANDIQAWDVYSCQGGPPIQLQAQAPSEFSWNIELCTVS